VQLGERDGDPDAGECAVHDGGADGERGPGRLEGAEQDLQQPRTDRDDARGPPAELLDHPGGDDGQACGGTADEEGRSAE
jgi:hypothetical protein